MVTDQKNVEASRSWLGDITNAYSHIWLYKSFVPPPPKICGTPGGPPITGPRIVLRDGRHLSYEEYGVPKEIAQHKIIFVHGHQRNKRDPFLTISYPFEEFNICIVGFDRPGYGESDPHPKMTVKSIALDIEELANHLELGSRFYVMGISAGGEITYGCLKYIPHRLSGAILACPGLNYWWPSLPSTLVDQELERIGSWQRMSNTIAHFSPWLLYWWNTQQIFTQDESTYNNMANNRETYYESDEKDDLEKYSTQQGVYESLYRDEMVVFGKWEFDPVVDIEKIYVGDNEGSFHIWQGAMDTVIPIPLQHYVAQHLPWIHYHEVPNATHFFSTDPNVKYQMLQALVTLKQN